MNDELKLLSSYLKVNNLSLKSQNKNLKNLNGELNSNRNLKIKNNKEKLKNKLIIQELNLELEKKNKIIEDLKSENLGWKSNLNIRDKKLLEYKNQLNFYELEYYNLKYKTVKIKKNLNQDRQEPLITTDRIIYNSNNTNKLWEDELKYNYSNNRSMLSNLNVICDFLKDFN